MITNRSLSPFKMIGLNEFVEFEGDKYFEEDLKTGEGLIVLLKLGYNLSEIECILFLKPYTIEKRIFESIAREEFDDVEEIFEIMLEDKCFPKVQLFKKFCNSKLSEQKFCKRENITYKKLEEIIDKFNQFSLAREMLKKRYERNKEFSKNNVMYPKSRGRRRSKCYKI